MVKKNQIVNKLYLKLFFLPKSVKTFSIVQYSKFNYVFLFSNNFFFKYKFNKRSMLVISKPQKIKVCGYNYSLFKTYYKIIDNLYSSIYYIKTKQLTVEGLGFKYKVKDNILYFIFGFSHLVKVYIPDNIHLIFNKKKIILRSFDNLLLRDFITDLKSIRPLDAYKAKGVRVKGEVIITKKGKQSNF